MTTTKTDATPQEHKGLMEALADRWDGPYFRLLFCGEDVLREARLARSLSRNSMDPVVCWQYVLSGALYCKPGTERFRVEAGEALITRHGEAGWMLSPVNEMPVEAIWLVVTGEPALELGEHLHAKYGSVQQFAQNSRVVRLARQIINLVSEEPHRTAHFWSEKTFEWMNAWWKDAQEHHVAWNHEGLDTLKPSSLIGQTPSTVKSLATQMGYSRSHLTRTLTQQWSRSPGAVLRKIRLQQAAALLRNTQLRIAEVAARTGYGAPEAFGRAFAQVYKQSPCAYRRSHKSAGPAVKEQ